MNGIIAGALLGVTGVILGAWGAHGLANELGAQGAASWATAVQYQQIHALALLSCGIWQVSSRRPILWLIPAMWCWMVGVLLFSGSIYALTLGGPRLLGPVTPLGGLLMIAGWCLLLIVGIKLRRG